LEGLLRKIPAVFVCISIVLNLVSCARLIPSQSIGKNPEPLVIPSLTAESTDTPGPPTGTPTIVRSPTWTPPPTLIPSMTPTTSLSPTQDVSIPITEKTSTPDAYWQKEPRPRDQYAAIDLEEEFRRIESRERTGNCFGEKIYDPKCLTNVDRTNPISVALRFNGYPNLDMILPDRVLFFYTSGIEATVIMLGLQLPDDAIVDEELRVDLVRENGIWRVVWAGYRFRCGRTKTRDWVMELCP
jgi:hypothetical protein